MLLIVSRGPTRRAQELIASGAVSNELLRAADRTGTRARVDVITSWAALAGGVRCLAHRSKMITVLPSVSTDASMLVTGLA